MSQDITFQQLLPVVTEEQEVTDSPQDVYLYEPSTKELLAEILPKNIEVQIFKAMLESVAGEHGARMTAMDSASKNASEMLMEIISGSESIKG